MSIKMNCRRSDMHQYLRFEVLTTMLLKMLRHVDWWIITDVSKNRIFMFWSSSPRTTVAVWHNEGEKGGELRSGWCCASDWPVSSAVATVLGLINPEYDSLGDYLPLDTPHTVLFLILFAIFGFLWWRVFSRLLPRWEWALGFLQSSLFNFLSPLWCWWKYFSSLLEVTCANWRMNS